VNPIVVRLFFASLLVGLLEMMVVGCNEFDPVSRITDFRLIAVRADKPYASPGERVELTTLSHEPLGRPVTWAWTTCVGPRDTTGERVPGEARGASRGHGERAGRHDRAGAVDLRDHDPGERPRRSPSRGAQQRPRRRGHRGLPGSLTVNDFKGVPQGELPFRCVEAGSDRSCRTIATRSR